MGETSEQRAPRMIGDGRKLVKSGFTFASEQARDLLLHNKLGNLDAIYQRGQAAHLRHTGRSVWDAHLSDANGDNCHVYIKMNWGRQRLWPRMTDLKTGQWLQSMPVREWHGIGTLGQLGLNVPERIAVFHEGIVNFRSAVIVRAVPPSTSLFELLQRGEWAQMESVDRQQILRAIAKVMRTIHSAGLGWRGTSAGHFYPEISREGEWNMWLIDCEGVHRGAAQKTIDRDDRKLLRSFELAGANEETLSMLADCLIRQLPETPARAA